MLPQEKMTQLLDRQAEIQRLMLENPDPETYVKLASEFSSLEPVVEKISALQSINAEIADLTELLADKDIDSEMKEMAESELPDLKAKIAPLEDDLQILLLPKDAADDKSAILEVRAGTGGSEAALFAGDLFDFGKGDVGVLSGLAGKQEQR